MDISTSLKGKKILHVLNLSIPNLTGYAIRSKYIIEFQKKLGLLPHVVTSPLYERDVPFENIDGVPYYRAFRAQNRVENAISQVPFLSQQVVMRRLQNSIDRIVRKDKIDLIHAHSPSLCGIPALKVARKRKIPLVYETRAFWEDAAVDQKRFSEGSLKYRISQMVEQKLFNKADAVIPICEGLKKEIFNRTGKDNLHVIKNGVDTSTFIPQTVNREIIDKYKLDGEIVVGFIGSFFTFEGLEDMIKSAPVVLKGKPNVTFLIVGGGIEDENVRNTAQESGLLGTKIIFTGKVPHDQVHKYYSVIDILVYPRISLRITELVTPLKPLEAMSMEKSVIASDVGGLRELIDDNETGLLFRSGDVRDLAEKILILANDKAKRSSIGKKAREKMIRDRDWMKIVEGHLPIYHRLLK